MVICGSFALYHIAARARPRSHRGDGIIKRARRTTVVILRSRRNGSGSYASRAGVKTTSDTPGLSLLLLKHTFFCKRQVAPTTLRPCLHCGLFPSFFSKILQQNIVVRTTIYDAYVRIIDATLVRARETHPRNGQNARALGPCLRDRVGDPLRSRNKKKL